LPVVRETLPAGHRRIGEVESMTGYLYLKQGRREESELLLTQGYETMRDALGEDNVRVLKAKARIDEFNALYP